MQNLHSTGSPEFLPARIGNEPITMSSREIADLCDKRHDNVVRDIETMLDALEISRLRFEGAYQDAQGKERKCYHLPRDLTMTLVTGYSIPLRKRVVDKLAEYEAGQLRLPTTAEAFANVFQMVADQERRHVEQDQAIKAIDARIERIEDTAPLKVKPQNTETLSEVRERINRKHGLPVRIINEVMGELPYSPRAFAMVKNSHENAKGSSFAVWRIIDVTKLFARFVGECIPATATTATHKDIEGRFKLTRKAGA